MQVLLLPLGMGPPLVRVLGDMKNSYSGPLHSLSVVGSIVASYYFLFLVEEIKVEVLPLEFGHISMPENTPVKKSWTSRPI